MAHVFPDGARTRRTELLPSRSRDAPLGIRSAAVSRPAPNFTHSLWPRRRVDPAVPRILGTPAVLARRGRYWVVFLLLLSDRTRSLDTGTRRSWLSFTTFTHWSGTSGSRRSVSRSHRYWARPHTAVPEGTSSCGIPFSYMRCDHRATAGLWPPRHPHPHPPPRGSGVRTELESRPGGRTVCKRCVPALPRPHPSVPCAACGCGKSFS